jgi:hypothetical protein
VAIAFSWYDMYNLQSNDIRILYHWHFGFGYFQIDGKIRHAGEIGIA